MVYSTHKGDSPMEIQFGPIRVELAQDIVEEALPSAAEAAGADVFEEFSHEKEALFSMRG